MEMGKQADNTKTEGEVTFYEDEHIYIYEGEVFRRELMSVNKAISLFFPKFDPQKVIEKYYEKWQRDKTNKYYGMTKKEIKNLWEQRSEDACKYGSMVHKEIENLFIGSKYGEYNEEQDYMNVTPEAEAFKKWFNQQWELGWRLWATEKIVYSEEYNIAGTVDLILYNDNLSSSREFKIVDFKTNDPESLHKEAYDYLKDPLHHLKASTMEKYRLQLNTYSRLFDDRFPIKKEILNLNDETYMSVEVQDRSKETNIIFKTAQKKKHH